MCMGNCRKSAGTAQAKADRTSEGRFWPSEGRTGRAAGARFRRTVTPNPHMKRHEAITKIMSPHVITVHHGDAVSKVRQLAAEHGIHHIPVVSGENLVGIISWSDILRVSFGDTFAVDQRAVDATLDHTFTIEQLMHKDPVKLADNATVRDAAEILARGEFHAVPIVHGTKLVGIVTTTDLIRYLLEQM